MGRHGYARALTGVLALVPVVALGASREARSTQQAGERPPAYVLRATSRWAAAINDVLSRVAQPVEIVVPPDQKAVEYLSGLCAGKPPQYEEAGVSERGLQKIRIPPCIRVRRDVEVEVTTGDTLEGLAIRHGLPPNAASRLMVQSASDPSPGRLANPESLKVGDTVILPEVPIWTNVVAKPDVAADRAAIVALLAAALQCGNEDPEECLLKREVTLLNRATVPKGDPAPEAAGSLGIPLVPPTVAAPAPSPQPPTAVASTPSAFPPTAATSAATSSAPPGQPPAVALPPPASAFTAAPAAAIATVPVAPEQWPYDVKLLAKILSDVADRVDRKTTIGIADGGLANAAGGPLPGAVFAPSAEAIMRSKRKRPEPDNDDNDGNFYVDDLFGAGLKRLNEDLGDLLGSGDMGLCRSDISGLTTWPSDVLTQASHGTIVTSIAAALRVRESAPAAADALPKVVFFRMLGDTCEPAADLNVDVGELFTAFEYLVTRSRVINISYKVDDTTGGTLRDRLKPLLPNLSALLILAAGNQGMKLDDNGAVCPACLGHSSDDRGGAAAKRTIVVGAATRDLRREPRSNYGRDTVKLFAPGDPTTGIDLLVNDVPATLASTSFAAPYAALAAAIVSSFGDQNTWADIRDRLEAAVWPLHDPDSGAEQTGLGVVDLVKAAAVRHDAVEVKENDANGRLVRRTYVGTLLTELDGQVCPGYQLTEAKVHALRLAEPGADGSRTVRVYHRTKRDPAAKPRRKVDILLACRPDGELRLRTIFGDEKTFSLSDVTQIQLPWIIDQ